MQKALTQADRSCDWRPKVPVRIYTASGDKDVPIANSYFCQDKLQAKRADVKVIDFGPQVDHGQSVPLALPHILRQFDEKN